MFCIHCGKSLVENAQFCAHCGEKVSNAPQPPRAPAPPVEQGWEYTFYRSTWKQGKGGRFNLTFGKTEYDARLDNWGDDESWIMPRIQTFLDKGWEPIGKIGPGNYHFRHHKDLNDIPWVEVYAFVVEFRRPARPLTKPEEQLHGTWQETFDPNKGFFRKLGNVVFDQSLTVQRERITFHKNRKFQTFDRDGKPGRDGVFFFQEDEGRIELFFKFNSDLDAVASVIGNRLVLKRDKKSGYVTREEYERITPAPAGSS